MQSILNFITLIILIVIIELFKIRQEIERFSLERHVISPADFTVEISGFNTNTTIQDIEEFF